MPRYTEYVNALTEGCSASRKEFAQYFDVHPTTAITHLEKAVGAGRLHKQIGRIGNQTGWLYSLPETTPRLEGL